VYVFRGGGLRYCKVMCGAVSGRQTFDEELSEGNEAEDIRRKHSVDVLILYIADDIGAVRAAGVVNCRDGGKVRSKTRQVELKWANSPRMSTLRRFCGTLVHSADTWARSVTSSCTMAICPPCCTPADLCAALAASATFTSWSVRRARRIRFEPP
jgi:hypothetical protein